MIGASNTQGQKYWVGIVQWAPETSVSEEIADIFRNYNIDTQNIGLLIFIIHVIGISVLKRWSILKWDPGSSVFMARLNSLAWVLDIHLVLFSHWLAWDLTVLPSSHQPRGKQNQAQLGHSTYNHTGYYIIIWPRTVASKTSIWKMYLHTMYNMSSINNGMQF